MKRQEFIEAEKERHPVSVICRVVKVSRAAYYKKRKATPGIRSQEDDRLSERMIANHRAKKETIGARGHVAELASQEIRCSRRRARRLMQKNGLVSCHKPAFVVTTLRGISPKLPDLVKRKFFAPKPNLLWVVDITYVGTVAGWAYLALVTDVFSRRPVGWAVADHMRTELPQEALEMALRDRKPAAGLIHHGDLGTQYTSWDYTDVLRAHELEQSAGATGVCWDNALAESVNGSFKKELIHREKWRDANHVRAAVAGHVHFYIHERRHSSLGYLTPQEFEDAHVTFGGGSEIAEPTSRVLETITAASIFGFGLAQRFWEGIRP